MSKNGKYTKGVVNKPLTRQLCRLKCNKIKSDFWLCFKIKHQSFKIVCSFWLKSQACNLYRWKRYSMTACHEMLSSVKEKRHKLFIFMGPFSSAEEDFVLSNMLHSRIKMFKKEVNTTIFFIKKNGQYVC